LTESSFLPFLLLYFTGEVFQDFSLHQPFPSFDDFTYNPNILLKIQDNDQSQLALHASENWPLDYQTPEYMRKFATVDHEQYGALRHSLIYPLTLVNGDPGTGKTHFSKELIKLLVKSQAVHGPIFVASYKNHALDSLLEGLFEFVETDKIIRDGGQIKSTNPKIKEISNIGKMIGREGGQALFLVSQESRDLCQKIRFWNAFSFSCFTLS
jgi:hypothetical protein